MTNNLTHNATARTPLQRMANTLQWLVRREVWEHKGGLLWAPVTLAGVMLILMLGTYSFTGHVGSHAVVQVDGGAVQDVATAIRQVPQEKMKDVLATGFFSSMVMLFAVPAFVVFFYCLGALFDERKDRSVLFWKSLPVSDGATVAAKAAIALVLAPVVTWAVAIAAGLMVVVFSSLAALFTGNAGGVSMLRDALLVWELALAPFQILGLLPLHVLWALPTVGWLLLVSSWARSKPFLWAVGVPVLAAGLVSWLNRIAQLGWQLDWLWRDVVFRLLLSAMPGSWVPFGSFHMQQVPHGPAHSGFTEIWLSSWSTVTLPTVWIGAALGLAMLAAAARMRRWREAD